MEVFKIFVESAVSIMKFEINLLGFNVSFWQMMIFFAVSGALISFFFHTME